MEIKTKFNVGDRVWVIDYCYEWTPAYEGEFLGEYGKIHEDIPEQVSIKTIGLVNKRDCFATQAEAQAECDRRNNGK